MFYKNVLNIQFFINYQVYSLYEYSPGQFEPFLLGNSQNENRILVFGRQYNANWANEMKTIYIDGTFRQAPPLFHQVYAVLAERNGYVFPIFYALLPNKQQNTYISLFKIC